MSQENVRLVREAFLATASGDPEAGRSFYDAAVEWDMSGVTGWPEKRVYRGREEVLAFLQAWADTWQDWHFDVEDVRDAGGEQAFVAIHEWGIGAGSGANVDQHRYFALTLRGGRAARVRMFSERAEALKAVGLEE
jgi:ketosteroid isomerase-like protein